MKYASSIRYGGELIEAEDCDYESYKQLGLLCPECKDPVFLKSKAVRKSKDSKDIKIAAHFSHFFGKDPAIVMACENRVKTYSKRDLEKLAKNTQNQRRKFFNRFFCKIIKKHLSLEYSWDFSRLILQNPVNKQIIQKFTRAYSDPEIFLSSIDNIQKCFAFSLESLPRNSGDIPLLIHKLNHFDDIQVNPDLNEAFRKSIISGLDIKMHKMVCTEALHFLVTKGARQILETLFALALGHIICSVQKGEIKAGKRIFSTPNNILFDTTASMVDNYVLTTPWIDSFSKANTKNLNETKKLVKA